MTSTLPGADGAEPPPSVYLGGASWGSGFYCGVIRALQERFGPDVGRHIEVHGDSAGALLGKQGVDGTDRARPRRHTRVAQPPSHTTPYA